MKTSTTLAMKYLSDIGNYKDSITEIDDKRIESITLSTISIKNKLTGETQDFKTRDAIKTLSFRIEFGLVDLEVTAQNAQAHAKDMLSILV